MKKVIAILISIFICFSLCGCEFINDVKDLSVNQDETTKTFEFDGISIDLTTDFLRMNFISDEYNFVVGNTDLTVMGIKMLNEETQLGDLTAFEFAEYFRSLMEEGNPTEVSEIDGIPTMQYFSNADGEELTTAVMFYKASDCFWLVSFTPIKDFEGMYADICKYAKTVKCE